MLTKKDITGLILAGGAGQRVNHLDKGLLTLNSQSMIEHQIAWIAPQVSQIIISANRNLKTYQSYGYQVVTDICGNYNGPLEGIRQGLIHCETPYLFVQPIDLPYLPTDLVEQVLQKVNEQCANDNNSQKLSFYLKSTEKEHYLCLLINKHNLSALEHFLSNNKRQVRAFLEEFEITPLDLDLPEKMFENLNYPEQYS